MFGPKQLVQLTAAVVFIAVAAVGATNAAGTHHASAGVCGEYMYWHNGHCVDARTKPGKDWTAAAY